MFYARHAFRGRKPVLILVCNLFLLSAIGWTLLFDEARAQTDAAPSTTSSQSSEQEREQAVTLARQGSFDEALKMLDDLHRKSPSDPDITRDDLAVLSWAGHDQQAVDLYVSLPPDQPDYVLAAVGHSYRQLHQIDKALLAYGIGLQKYPNNAVLAEGEIRCLIDDRQMDEALAKAKAYLGSHAGNSAITAIKNDLLREKDSDQHQKAIDLARQKHYKDALDLLRELESKSPGDISLKRDHLAVLDWQGGHDKEVAAIFQALPAGDDTPDYVLAAAAHAYRNLGKIDKALELYRRGIKQFPDSEVFATGIIRCLTDKGDIDKAVTEANVNLRQYGNRLQVLLAAGDAADHGKPYDALRYYEAAEHLSPKNKDALQGIIRNDARVGAAEPALELAEKNPVIVPEIQQRQLQGDEAAALVRYGVVKSETEETRYAATDRALARLDGLISQWSAEGPNAQPAILRARFDRILALRNRARNQEAIDEYNNLLREGVTPPDYIFGAVGDAYLSLRQPETARDFFLHVLQKQPHDFDSRRQLYYAYNESFDYYNAYATADGLMQDQPLWFRLRGDPGPVPNYNREAAEYLAGEARISTGEVADAHDILFAPVTAAPGAATSREALGDLYAAHGWPREALEQHQIGVALNNGKDVDNEIGIASNELELQDFPAAEASAQNLLQRFPENTNVQRVNRAWQVHDMAEIEIKAGREFNPMTSSGGSVTGGEAYGIETNLYSAPIDYNWRIFAGEFFAHQEEAVGEGNVSLSSSKAGIEYRNGPLIASLAPTFNHYHDSQRVGIIGAAETAIGDQWKIGGGGQLFAAHETPLRALNAGITANFYNIGATWRQDEARAITFGADLMPFSDGNLRAEVNANLTQRLWTTPYIKLDGLAELSRAQNTKDANRPYYNPAQDLMGLFGARAVQALYQRYSTLYQHSFMVTPGVYWEHHYGYDGALRMRYEQDLFLDDVFEAGWGVDFQRQSYDGAPENDVDVTFNLTRRF